MSTDFFWGEMTSRFAVLESFIRWRSGMATRRRFHDYFEGIFRWSARQLDGSGGFSQREPMGNEAADIQLAGEDEPGHFVLQREIG